MTTPTRSAQPPNFQDRLHAAQETNKSVLTIALAPSLEKMPLPMQRHDDSFLPFGKAIIDATHDLVCAYLFDLAAYLALGASGAIALERTLAYVPAALIRILHGPFASPDFARAVSESAFTADAVTMCVVKPSILAPYLEDARRGVFVDASDGARAKTLLALYTRYPAQIGVYTTGSEPRTLSLLDQPQAQLRWHAEDITHASRAADFQDAVRHAALARRVGVAAD